MSALNLIGKIEPFYWWDDWNVYSERLDQFLELNEVPEEKKVALLIGVCIGSECYKVLRDLCHPVLPKEKTFEELCELLRRHFVPRVAVFRERINFYVAKQETSETVTAWYARLKHLSVDCRFGSNLTNILLDKFVTGMRSGPILDRLCEESESLTLEEAIEIAVSKEAALEEPEEEPEPPEIVPFRCGKPVQCAEEDEIVVPLDLTLNSQENSDTLQRQKKENHEAETVQEEPLIEERIEETPQFKACESVKIRALKCPAPEQQRIACDAPNDLLMCASGPPGLGALSTEINRVDAPLGAGRAVSFEPRSFLPQQDELFRSNWEPQSCLPQQDEQFLPTLQNASMKMKRSEPVNILTPPESEKDFGQVCAPAAAQQIRRKRGCRGGRKTKQ